MSKENEQAGRVDADAAPTPSNAPTPSPLVTALQHTPESTWGGEILEAFGEVTLVLQRERLFAACSFLKTAPGLEFNFLSDICGVDLGPEEEPRFEVNYHLFSIALHHRLRLKVRLTDEDAHVPSVVGIWRTANWHERETYDLFGVVFDDHPDLRRILLPDDWEGHALRKDFPLRGYEPYSLT